MFYSGPGSATDHVVSPYISLVGKHASSKEFFGSVFVDLGCGDFSIGKQLLPVCSRYIGVDIVKPVIDTLQQEYGNATTHFMHLDIVGSELPRGDVCFVRQVFQHLSNAQILSVLPKLRQYQYVYITEHYPTDNPGITPNLNKAHGGDVRVYDNSGVYLDLPPFELPADRLAEVLCVPGAGLGKHCDQGVIRTFLYRPVSQSHTMVR